MPSPIGHALAGLSLHLLLAKDRHAAGDLRRAAVIVGAALAPDLDLLFRFVDGRNHHQAEAHSVGAALLAMVVASVAAARVRAKGPLGLGLATGCAWVSHLLLDLLSIDTHPPIGLMAFWPLSHAYVKSPWPLFLDIGRTLEWSTVTHNALAVAWEILLLAPLLMVVRGARARRE